MEIADIISSYIEARDNARTNGSGIIGMSTFNRMTQFSQMVNAHAATLANRLPAMNLAEWEAFAELANARLNDMRMSLHKR